MNVKELKEAIANLPDDMEIILQKYSEGNGYNRLHYANSNACAVFYKYEIDIYDERWSAEDAGMEEDEWEQVKNTHKVLVLAP